MFLLNSFYSDAVHFELTRDLGKTWQVIGPINDASKFNAIQPSIFTYPDGRMQVLCRTQERVVAQSWSKDGGKSWSKLSATNLPNPNSGTDAVSLADGRQLLVYNRSSRRRSPLNIALSRDGKTWQDTLVLEKGPGEYSYPAVIQTTDGLVHVTYSWNLCRIRHVVIDPAQI